MEEVDIVDDEDRVIGKSTLKESNEKKLRRRADRIIVFNADKKILIQKRASHLSNYPGMWEIGVGETIKSGESYDKAALRGVKEELGTDAINMNLIEKVKYDNDGKKRFYGIYECTVDENIVLSDETDEYLFVSREELTERMDKIKFAPWSYFLVKWIKSKK